KGLKREQCKRQGAAVARVPETMASVYKILPLALRDNMLTVAMSDPGNLPAIDDLRNLLSISEVTVQLAPAKWIAENMAKFYAGKEETIVDIIQQLEADTTIGTRRGETSIDLEDMMEMAEAAPVRKLINMVFLL